MPSPRDLYDDIFASFILGDDRIVFVDYPNRFRGNVADDVREYIGDGFHFMGASGGSNSMSSYNIFFQMICRTSEHKLFVTKQKAILKSSVTSGM